MKITIANNSSHAAHDEDQGFTPSVTPNADSPESITEANPYKRPKLAEGDNSIRPAATVNIDEFENHKEPSKEEVSPQPPVCVNAKESMLEHILQKACMTAF